MGAAERSDPRRHQFPRRVRLCRHEEFARVFAHNMRVADDLFTVLARRNELLHARLGLAISRKAVVNAVDRNRIKRIAREQFRLGCAELPALDFVVLARPRCTAASSAALATSLLRLWRKIAARCES